MSRRKSTGSDTALVKAMVRSVKGKASAITLAHDMVDVLTARSRHSNSFSTFLCYFYTGTGRDVSAPVHYSDHRKKKILRRVRKKLGQPFRKNMNRKRMHRRAAGKNEVTQ